MPHLRLPAGTDVAEMALFDVDSLPRRHEPDGSSVLALTTSNQLVRFPTGADGGYLLHLFVDEPIPADIQRFCLVEDKLSGAFSTSRGNIAFGGLESTHANFKPNQNIRTDGSISPGDYSYTAFHTEFPDELIEQACRVERNSRERWLSRTPVTITLITIASAVSLAISHRFWFIGLALLAGYFSIKKIQRLPAFQEIKARRDLAQLELPSIVIEMWSQERSGTKTSDFNADQKVPHASIS